MSRAVIVDLISVVVCLVLGVFLAVVFVGCGDNREAVRLLDAAPDGEIVPPDVTQVGCCVNYPDEDAIRSCASAQLPPETCAVFVCPRPPEDGGGNLKLNVCGPFPTPDAGTDPVVGDLGGHAYDYLVLIADEDGDGDLDVIDPHGWHENPCWSYHPFRSPSKQGDVQ